MNKLLAVKTQVLIVGAGPTGLSLAVQLLRYGIDFIIIEKNPGTTPLSKAVVVQARTLEIFQELGLDKKAINRGQPAGAFNLFYKGKKRAKINLSKLGEGLSPFTMALSLEQSKTEKLLVEYLTENNKSIQWGNEFNYYKEEDNLITSYFTGKDGERQTVKSDYIVGCDGASSLIRHQMGQAFKGDTVPKIFYVADVKLHSPVISTNELYVFLFKKGFVLFFPMEGEGHYRVIGILPGADPDQEFKFSDIQDDIKKQIESPVDFKEVIWFSHYKVHSRKADAFMKGRCFIAGDAAHIHTPAGGQGMNTGIQDAYNLAWKIAYKLNGKINQETLNTYNLERTDNAKHLLHSTDRMFDIIAGRNSFWNFVRLTIFTRIAGLITGMRPVNKLIFPLISQTGITYPENILVTKSSLDKIKSGVRMPHFILPDGSGILEHLKSPQFKIIYFGSDEAKLLFDERIFKMDIMKIHLKEIPANLFGKEKDFYILLRPDNHISYIGKEKDAWMSVLNKVSAN